MYILCENVKIYIYIFLILVLDNLEKLMKNSKFSVELDKDLKLEFY